MTQYVNAAVDNIKTHLKEHGQALKAKTSRPLPENYRPEINISDELGDSESSYSNY